LDRYSRIAPGVAREIGVTTDQLLGPEKTKPIIAARRYIVANLRAMKFSLTVIGLATNRNHTSISRMAQFTEEETIADLDKYARTSAYKNIQSCDRQRGYESYRQRFNRVRLAMMSDEMTPIQRATLWRETCRIIWPYNWKDQFAQYPHGVDQP
jgi:hypothetical protein